MLAQYSANQATRSVRSDFSAQKKRIKRLGCHKDLWLSLHETDNVSNNRRFFSHAIHFYNRVMLATFYAICILESVRIALGQEKNRREHDKGN